MRLQLALIAAATAFTAGGAQAASVDIHDAVARVTVIPEDRSDVRVEITSANARLPLKVTTRATAPSSTATCGTTSATARDGQSGSRHRARGRFGSTMRTMPQVVIHTPRGRGAVHQRRDPRRHRPLGQPGTAPIPAAAPGPNRRCRRRRAAARVRRLARCGWAPPTAWTCSSRAPPTIHATAIRQGLDARLSGAGNIRVDQTERLDGRPGVRRRPRSTWRTARPASCMLRSTVSARWSSAQATVPATWTASISGLGLGADQRGHRASIRKSVSGGGLGAGRQAPDLASAAGA